MVKADSFFSVDREQKNLIRKITQEVLLKPSEDNKVIHEVSYVKSITRHYHCESNTTAQAIETDTIKYINKRAEYRFEYAKNRVAALAVFVNPDGFLCVQYIKSTRPVHDLSGKIIDYDYEIGTLVDYSLSLRDMVIINSGEYFSGEHSWHQPIFIS